MDPLRRFTAAALIIALLITGLSGCGRRAEEDAQPDVTEPEVIEPAPMSGDEAASHNARISPSAVNLVQLEEPRAGSQMAVIKTNFGDIEVMLYPEQAPKAVENFITHARAGYYDQLDFEKVFRNFIIEGGDPGGGGESIYRGADGHPGNEYSLDLWHLRGAVAMSQLAGKDEYGSRFFIVQAPFVDADTIEAMEQSNYPNKVIDAYKERGGTPGFDWQRTVFGTVTEESMRVVDAIARLEVSASGSPTELVIIETVEIVTYSPEQDDAGEDDEEEEEE